MALIIVVGLFYLIGWYAAAFWVIVDAIVNWWLGVVGAIVNPIWLYRNRAAHGFDQDYSFLAPGLFDLATLVIVKIIVTAAFIVVAVHVGRHAGYFSFGSVQVRRFPC